MPSHDKSSFTILSFQSFESLYVDTFTQYDMAMELSLRTDL